MRCLRKTQSLVQVLPSFQQQVGKVVGSVRLVWPDPQRLSEQFLRMLHIAASLLQSTKTNKRDRIVWAHRGPLPKRLIDLLRLAGELVKRDQGWIRSGVVTVEL